MASNKTISASSMEQYHVLFSFLSKLHDSAPLIIDIKFHTCVSICFIPILPFIMCIRACERYMKQIFRFLCILLLTKIPMLDSMKQLADFIIVPTMNAFFFTMNASTYLEAAQGCSMKGMTLAIPNGTDVNTVFGPPGLVAWIGGFNELESDLETKKVAISITPSPTNPTIIYSLPVLIDQSFSFPYICQRINAKSLEIVPKVI